MSLPSDASPMEGAILDHLPCGVVVLDAGQNIVFANPFLCTLVGRSLQNLRGDTLCSLGIADEQQRRISAQEWWEWAENTTLQLPGTLRSAAGRSQPVMIAAQRSRGATEPGYLYLCVLPLAQQDEWPLAAGGAGHERQGFGGLIGKSAPMQLVYEQIEMAGATDVTVIIQGASGTGKELVAAAIHHASARSGQPLVRINCAALAETLLESELFGHVKGAFSGAYRDRQGTFEAASGGTLLLDEIGEISPAVQVRLLRVLQEKVVTRVGDTTEIAVDVRIIAATNKNLRQLVSQGRFREDLFYRLNVFPIHTPPLAQRKSDIALLCAHFVRRYREHQGSSIESISADAMRLLMEYCWPGNVRELENAIAYAFVVCKGDQIQLTDLPHELRVKALREGICAESLGGASPLKNVERLAAAPQKLNGRLPISAEQLTEALQRNGGSRNATAAALGISTVALWRKMKAFGIR